MNILMWIELSDELATAKWYATMQMIILLFYYEIISIQYF